MAKEKRGIMSRLSLMPAGLRYKLMIVFCLMSIIPLMICVYITTNFVFPYAGFTGSLSIVIAITIIIALLGFALAKNMIEPIIDIAIEAKLIAGGDFERSVEIKEDSGEIGELATSLNSMSDKIRSNLTELKSYGDQTREINEEIHKKVMVLSGLLQVGNLISAGTDLKSVLDILVEKVSLLDGTNPAGVLLIDKDRDNLIPFSLLNINGSDAKLPASLKRGLFARLRTEVRDIIIDKNLDKEDEAVASFRSLYSVRNAIIIPIVVRGNLEGVVVMGNNEDDFEYKVDDVELLHVFCKQAAIAIENDKLMRKTEELEVKDELTGLYNYKFIRERLDEEISRGIMYQRPCGFLLFGIDNFSGFCERHGRMAGESALKKIGSLISSELTPVDKAARFSDDEFALVLPERNKKEAKDIADEISTKISEIVILPSAADDEKSLTVSAGLSENPIDGINAKDLIKKAKELLDQAKGEGKNTIKVK